MKKLLLCSLLLMAVFLSACNTEDDTGQSLVTPTPIVEAPYIPNDEPDMGDELLNFDDMFGIVPLDTTEPHVGDDFSSWFGAETTTDYDFGYLLQTESGTNPTTELQTEMGVEVTTELPVEGGIQIETGNQHLTPATTEPPPQTTEIPVVVDEEELSEYIDEELRTEPDNLAKTNDLVSPFVIAIGVFFSFLLLIITSRTKKVGT